MTWAAELVRIRRFLRDPEGKIWSTDTLRELWNAAQAQLTREVGVLRDVRVLAIPPRYQGSYLFAWEWAARGEGTRWYRALVQAGGHFAATWVWETQVFAGVAGEADDDSGYAYTHPWEAYLAGGALPAPVALPDDAGQVLGLYYDGEPLEATTRRLVQRTDPTWRRRAGKVFAYYWDGDLENEVVLYPRPSSITWDDAAGSGWVTSVAGDTTADDQGLITQRTGSVLSGDAGVSVDTLEQANNLLMVYDVAPRRLSGLSDEVDLPGYLWRYVRYRVLQLAYETNSDGRIPSLAAFWRERWGAGLTALKRFRQRRLEDRTYTLSGVRGARRGSTRHPRLPDSYPPV